MGGLFPAFGGIKEVSVLALVVSQVTLIQNNQYAQVSLKYKLGNVIFYIKIFLKTQNVL